MRGGLTLRYGKPERDTNARGGRLFGTAPGYRGNIGCEEELRKMSCVFCAIVSGDAPAISVYEDDDYLAFLDIRPVVRGHTLVVPRTHTVDLTDTPPATLADMVRIGQRIGLAARASELNADGNNIAVNDGRAAFQSVFHIHLHVTPRHSGDKLALAKGLLVRRDSDREATGRILRDALADID